MRVLHVIPSLSPSSGGPSFALPAMARSLTQHGVSLVAATTDDDGRGRRLSGITLGMELPQDGGWSAIYFPKQTEFYKASLPLCQWLKRHVADYNLVHVHALFSCASLAGARAARHHGVPYIIRPLGVLNRWGMENRRRWIKALSFRLLELPLLNHAAAIHYTTCGEMREAERLGIAAKPVVIPIGIALDPFQHLPPPGVFYERFPETRATENILFLSRIDPKKGLDLLLPAFAAVRQQRPNARLIIAGDGDANYTAQLKASAKTLGIASAITWTGFLDGEQRLASFSAAKVFVLPSYSENFGVALLEAMAAGLPCIASDQVALAVDAAAHHAVRMVPCKQDDLMEALRALLMDSVARQSLSQNAGQLSRMQYSLTAMGDALAGLYDEAAAIKPRGIL